MVVRKRYGTCVRKVRKSRCGAQLVFPALHGAQIAQKRLWDLRFCESLSALQGTKGTSSTNTVAPSNAPASQSNVPPASASRKGTFTDDLHKLVDNWARDAMNLTGKKSKTSGHPSYEGPGMARKFSAPGQLCVSMTPSLGVPVNLPAASATSLAHFPVGICPTQQFGFPGSQFQVPWSSSGGPPTAQPLNQFPPAATSSLQNFNISTLQKSISNPQGSNLRTT